MLSGASTFAMSHLQPQLAVRLSNLRCGFKKVAAAEVKGFYLLIGGDACRERIKSLTTSMEYIYPKSQVCPRCDYLL